MEPFPRYQGKELKATKEAAEELWQFRHDLWDVLDVLEEGYPCSRSPRKSHIVENCIRRGSKICKAVVVDCGSYWLVIHFGIFSYKRR